MKNKNNHNNDNINGNNSIKKHQKSLICIYTNFEVLSFSREKRLIMIIISFQKVLESVSFCFVGYNVEYIIQPFELTYPIVRRLKFYYFHQSRLFLSVF